MVDLSNPEAGIDIRQQGGNRSSTALRAALPDHLRRRSDVTDFATPVTSMTAQQVGDRVRLTVTRNGLWEHNAYQSDNRFVLEVRRVAEDPTKLGGGRSDYKGDKLAELPESGCAPVLQVIADFTDFNIITSDSVQGNLTLRLKDVPWDRALDIILQAKGLDMQERQRHLDRPGDELCRGARSCSSRPRQEIVDPSRCRPRASDQLPKAKEIFDFQEQGPDHAFGKRGAAWWWDERSNKVQDRRRHPLAGLCAAAVRSTRRAVC